MQERSSLLHVERRLVRCFQDALSDTSLGDCFKQVPDCCPRVPDKLLEDEDLGLEETGQE